MDVERALVSKVAHTGSADEVLGRGIEPRHFVDDECKQLWESMRDHMLQYGSTPSMDALKAKHPGFRFDIVTDSLSYIIDEFTAAVRRREAIDALRDIAEVIDRGDRDELGRIEELFLERARSLSQVVPTSGASRFSNMLERIRGYMDMIKKGNVHGVPLGIPTIDELILGVQPHELVTVAGWQGKGKSTLLQHSLFHAYLQGHSCLLLTLEMGAPQVQRKFDAMATHLVYHAMKAGKLDPAGVKQWEKAANRASKAKNDIVVLDKLGKCTVDRVYAEAVRYKPDIVGLDYITLMHTREGQSHWEKVTYITQSLKQIAASLNVPIFAAAQTNIGSYEEGAGLHNIGYSRSIGQDSDIVLGLHQTDEMKAQKRMEVRMLKNRDGDIRNVTMHWEMETMDFREITPADMFTRKH